MDKVQAQFAEAVRQVDCRVGRTMAQSVLDAATASGDRHLQARALSLLAECENLLSAHESAFEQGTRAVLLFQELGDIIEEARALAALSQSASALGRNDQAIEAAMLGLQLAQQTGELPRQAEAHIQLGSALQHARCFDAAVSSLQEAQRLGVESGTPLNVLHGLVVEGGCEVTRVVCERHEMGRLASLASLRDVCRRFDVFAAANDMEKLAEPDQRPLQINWTLISSLAHSWQGEVRLAREGIDEAGEWMHQNPVAPWLESLYALAECEWGQAKADWATAEQSAARMIHIGNTTGREQAALLGHLVKFHVLDACGQASLAVEQLRLLAARERRIRAEMVASRVKVVAWQLEVRRVEKARRDMQASAQHFERLTMEDQLTGIANRRCFEAAAGTALAEASVGGRQPCIALIDVDRFKAINDTFGHLIGDKVLQEIASLLEAHVREDDLAARLAGDEFVLLLRCAGLKEAQDICERVSSAVCSFDWSAVAPRLSVSISLGVAQALREETLQQLIHRSDVAMYERKSLGRSEQRGAALA